MGGKKERDRNRTIETEIQFTVIIIKRYEVHVGPRCHYISDFESGSWASHLHLIFFAVHFLKIFRINMQYFHICKTPENDKNSFLFSWLCAAHSAMGKCSAPSSWRDHREGEVCALWKMSPQAVEGISALVGARVWDLLLQNWAHPLKRCVQLSIVASKSHRRG